MVFLLDFFLIAEAENYKFCNGLQSRATNYMRFIHRVCYWLNDRVTKDSCITFWYPFIFLVLPGLVSDF